MRGSPVLLGVVAAALVLSLAACSGEGDTGDGGEPGLLRVVTSVSPITSIAENIGGTRIKLEGIIPEGVNSHTFSPPPSIARLMADADLIVLNGLFLEEPALEMAEANKREDAVVLTLGDRSISSEEWAFDFSFPESEGIPNPHLWTDPILALKYAELIRDALVGLDPPNADYYRQNYVSFKDRIEELDRAIAASVETVPPASRRLLTYHDSFPYFAQRYGMEVVAAVQPSDFSEPSAREVARLIDQVRESQVAAIFGSEVFPSPVMAQIAKEGGARFVDQLRDDDLPGSRGDPGHTYLGLMVFDVRIMVEALGGSAEALKAVDTSVVFEGESLAKYR